MCLSKSSGLWRPIVEVQAYSPGFETNDIGFLQRTDIISTHAVMQYVNEDTTKYTREVDWWFGKYQNWNYGGDKIADGASARLAAAAPVRELGPTPEHVIAGMNAAAWAFYTDPTRRPPALDYLATGLSTERVPEDDIVVPVVHFTKDNGELSSISIDEHTKVVRLA